MLSLSKHAEVGEEMAGSRAIWSMLRQAQDEVEDVFYGNKDKPFHVRPIPIGKARSFHHRDGLHECSAWGHGMKRPMTEKSEVEGQKSAKNLAGNITVAQPAFVMET